MNSDKNNNNNNQNNNNTNNSKSKNTKNSKTNSTSSKLESNTTLSKEVKSFVESRIEQEKQAIKNMKNRNNNEI